jgi:hypothetical protein
MKLYIILKDNIWENATKVLGIFSTQEMAQHYCDMLSTADNNGQTFYSIHDTLCLDDASLITLRIETLNRCINTKHE